MPGIFQNKAPLGIRLYPGRTGAVPAVLLEFPEKKRYTLCCPCDISVWQGR